MSGTGDAFLSDEDLDLRTLTHDELIQYWNLWLTQAQITNELDEALYTHGVFERDPAVSSRSQSPGSDRPSDSPETTTWRSRATEPGR